MLGGARVAPLDLVALVEQEDAVRRRLHRRDELGQAHALDLGAALEAAQAALDAVADLAPQARVARRGVVVRAAQPAQQTPAAQRIERDHRGEADQAAEQGADQGATLTGDDQAGERAGDQAQQRGDEAWQQPAHRREEV